MISVVVPAHNEEKYIENCLKAIRKQKYKNYEIIVVDNCSTDRTAEIAEKYADKIVHEPRKGVAFARQKGFEVVKGDIIASTDADTVVDENWLDEINQTMSNGFSKNIVGVYGPIYLLDGNAIEKILAKYGFTFFLKANHHLKHPHFVGMNFAVKGESFNNVGGFDLSMESAEDFSLSMKLREEGEIFFNSKMLVYTSARRLNAGYIEFLKHHTANYLSVNLNGESLDFDDIR